MTGALVGCVGGGSPRALAELTTDIVLGGPIAVGAFAVSWCGLPKRASALLLLVLRFLGRYASWPTLKRVVTRIAGWVQRPISARWERLGGAAAFEERTARRMRELEGLA